MNNYLLLSYTVLVSLSIYSKLFNQQLYKKLKITPLILLSSLLIIKIYHGALDTFTIFLFIGLIMGMTGDLFLLNTDKFFIFGLASFLTGHLFYIIAFLSSIEIISISVFLLLIAVGLLYLKILFSKMEISKIKSYRIPIIAYLLTIITMFSTAFNYEFPKDGSLYLIIGSTFFVISDGTLAWNTFVNDFKGSELIISLTYYAAQFFIISKALTI